MKQQKRLKVMGMCIVCLIFITYGALVRTMKVQAQPNVKTIGNVRISLDDREEDEKEVEYLTPGQEVRKEPVITVEKGSKTAYLRAYILVHGLNESQREELLEGVVFSEGWRYDEAEGYYEYQYPVEENTKVSFFTKLVIPKHWENLNRDLAFEIDVLAEGIEADRLQ